MKLSLIGMSGSGKSHWSQRLEAQGFTRFCIDELIQQRLAEGNQGFSFKDIHDVASWMGFPYEANYRDASSRYLALEKEILNTVLRTVKNLPATKDIVVDTTGSVIYTGKNTLDALTAATTLFYLETPASAHTYLYQQYLKDPKPVIWGDTFSQKPGETTSEALGRCYPELLSFRSQAYEALADYTLKHELIHDQDLKTEAFVAYLRTLHNR